MNIISLSINDLKEMYNLFIDVSKEEFFLKEISFLEFKDKLINSELFSFDYVYGIKENNKLISYCIGIKRNNNGFVNMIIVKKEYRCQGIGSKLLTYLENKFKENNILNIYISYFLPLCYSWYIPNTNKHDHPCAPGIRFNSDEYFFFIHRGYNIYDQADAFHLDLCNYNISDEIVNILEKNKENGINIEVYDSNKHYGINEFCDELNIKDFEKVIKGNLELKNPYPFLVVTQNNKVVGWTGAMWNEDSGRGHFDGIAILKSVRGNGLGKALFSLLALYNKNNGAKFMTFYTGLNNYARYIYMGAGFKIVQSFALFKKEIK